MGDAAKEFATDLFKGQLACRERVEDLVILGDQAVCTYCYKVYLSFVWGLEGLVDWALS